MNIAFRVDLRSRDTQGEVLLRRLNAHTWDIDDRFAYGGREWTVDAVLTQFVDGVPYPAEKRCLLIAGEGTRRRITAELFGEAFSENNGPGTRSTLLTSVLSAGRGFGARASKLPNFSSPMRPRLPKNPQDRYRLTRPEIGGHSRGRVWAPAEWHETRRQHCGLLRGGYVFVCRCDGATVTVERNR